MPVEQVTLAGLHKNGIRAAVVGRSAARDDCNGIRLQLHESTEHDGYANAQIDDYRVDRRNALRWRANVEMTIRARFSLPGDRMTGTAGFGFWNAPLGISVRSVPAPPAAVWFFFAGPNSNIAAARGLPGRGWKAASVDTRNRLFLALLPFAPVAVPLMRVPAAYDTVWPLAQRAMRVDEKLLTQDLHEWHKYTLTWTRKYVRYTIDGDEAHICHNPPRAPMGFVAWIDNQYMVATPQGAFGRGTVAVDGSRSLEISALSLRKI